jgi:putative transcriptional regulator
MSSLAPGLLVAAPPLGDPNFDQSVVLLASHGSEGAFGWIINGRNVMTLQQLLKHVDIDVPPTLPDLNVRLGGPVGQEQVWLLYPSSVKLGDQADEFDVGCGITASPSQRVLRAVVLAGVPKTFLGVLGYAGWGPDQLENEIRRGAWFPMTDASPSLIFDVDREDIWRSAYERVGVTPMAFTSRTVGSA